MRVLITNNALAERAGTEMFVRDLAIALLRRGHHPVAYSQILGEVAAEIRASTVPVVDDLAAVTVPPDVIHGHHHLETMTALHHFPGVPAVFFCHGWMPWQEAPPVHPRIARYVAVDELCRERLVSESGIPPEKTEVLFNFVDLDRFRPRPALPERPVRALLYSNHAAGSRAVADEVRRACDGAGIDLDVVGLSAGNPSAAPEKLLPLYDLVFAKARAALEAMAVGCAVIPCDAAGSGPMVNDENFDALRSLNFGIRTLTSPVGADVLEAQIARFDRDQTAKVSARVRSEAALSDAVERVVGFYREAVGRDHVSAIDESRASAEYLRGLAPRIKQREALGCRLSEATEEAERWRKRAEACREELERERRENAKRLATLESNAASQVERVRALEGERDRAYGTLTWRLRERVLESRTGRGLRRMIERFR